MKVFALLLALSTAASQTVQIEDCCCGAFCLNKNACTGCGEDSACPVGKVTESERLSAPSTWAFEAALPRPCGEEEKDSTCSHIEPSTEMLAGSLFSLEIPVHTLLESPADSSPAPFLDSPVLAHQWDAIPPPRSKLALHIQLSVFLI